MIRKSGNRFSDKIMLKQKRSGMTRHPALLHDVELHRRHAAADHAELLRR